MTEKRYTLLDENKQLKQIIKELEMSDTLTDYETTIMKLREENEQLKKELFECEKEYIIETYHDNAIRRDEKIQSLKEEFKARFGDVE